MRRTGSFGIGAAVLAVVIGGCSQDGTKPPSPERPGAGAGAVGTGGAGASVASDEDFVRDVAMKHMAAIELSRIAQATTTNPAIKSFAQSLVDDHTAAATKLKSLVTGQAHWPDELDEKHRKATNELTQNKGADFDRDYLKAMVDGHQDLAAKLETRIDVQSLADWKTAAAARTQSRAMPEPALLRDVTVRPAESGNDTTARINKWAAEMYPVAHKHLDTARTLEAVRRDGGMARQP